MAVTSDIGNANDVHPKEKITIGKRLAQWALSKEYHKTNIAAGPLYKNYKIEKQLTSPRFCIPNTRQ